MGGVVPSFLELILTQPASGVHDVPEGEDLPDVVRRAGHGHRHGGTLLTLADGEAATGSKLGHLSSGAKRLPLPLEARVGTAAFQPLDASVDPLLKKWSDVGTQAEGDGQVAPEGQEQGLGQLPQGGLGHAFDGDAVAASLQFTEEEKKENLK